MRIPFINTKLLDFSELDRQIEKMRELRDSYRNANILHYGKQLASLLND